MTDEMRLRQILFNLTSNAIKFTNRGRVTVTFAARETDGANRLHIDVADTGIGIPDTEFEHIFETFSQVDQGAARQFGGTGLGLAICRRLARAMGGDVTVTSVLGKGSVFSISLPLEAPHYARPPTPETAATPAARAAPRQLCELEVLLVEDNLINRKVVEQLLSPVVGEIDVAEDGVQGVEAVQTKHYDVVLMDKQMPNMDGVTATKTIRSMTGPAKDVYIIAVTADAFEGEKERLIAQGMDDYIAKPVNQDMLVQAILAGLEKGLKHRPPASHARAS